MEFVMLKKCGTLSVSLTLFTLLALLGCGTTLPPKELVSARTAFQQAKDSQAQELAPVELEEARQALAKADASFEDEGDDPATRYLAYYAERKALTAKASAGTESARRVQTKAEDDLKAFSKEAVSQLKEEREQSERDKQALEAERKARQEAEKKLGAALASLDKIAQVKEESRGVVITLSGSVLFATGKSELLPIAQTRLDEVAKAVKDQGYKQIVVEGHTDSVGSAQNNYDLSRRRAESVRSYLVSRGIDSNKIEAKGIGKDRPVADNGTPEGRANNRRVELIVTPEK